MRHGQTNWNLLGLCNDDPAADVHLTALGREQAGAVGERLAAVPLQRIYCSRLPRTRETAEIVNRGHAVPIEARPELDDIRSGFDGRPVEDYFAAAGGDRLHRRLNGGESLLDYRERVLGFVDWLRPLGYEQVLAVAHEETLRVLHAHFTGLPPESLDELHFDNAALLDYEL